MIRRSLFNVASSSRSATAAASGSSLPSPLSAAPRSFSTTAATPKAKAVTPYSLPFPLPLASSNGKKKAASGAKATATASPLPYKQIPDPRGAVQTPKDFLDAISTPPTRALSDDSSLLGALGESWSDLWKCDSHKLKEAGVGVKERRYVLWSMEKYRQGYEPHQFRIKPKKKKIVRGCVGRKKNTWLAAVSAFVLADHVLPHSSLADGDHACKRESASREGDDREKSRCRRAHTNCNSIPFYSLAAHHAVRHTRST